MEQAIFTSVRTNQTSGYHLVCRSGGLTEEDARELTAWGPSHDSLVDRTAAARSVNFFPLSRGLFSVSRTITAGEEYSERGGWRIFTHYLVISPAELARFANNPFAVIRAALAAGEFIPLDVLPQQLGPLSFGGKSAMIDRTLLYRLSARVSAEDVSELIGALFDNQQLVVCTDIESELLVAGIINLLPLERRPQLSFSTGLRSSLQRPFRLTLLPPNAEAEIKHAIHSGMEVRRLFKAETQAVGA